MLVKDQVAALEADAGLEPRARERAIATARRVGDQLNAINSWVWGRVEYAPRGQPPESYVPELRLAEEVCRQWEHRSFVNTLGVAQLRAGRTAEAYESLRRSMALRQGAMPGAGEDLYDTVYLAIAAHRLGREDEARRYRDLTLQLAPRELGNDEQGTIVREMLEELGG
jgi:hypothetical protein